MPRPKGGPVPNISFDNHKIRGAAHWTPTWCAAHHFENVERGLTKCPHGCPPGPMMRTLWTPASEICIGGARGGGKTETGRGWLLKGNFDETDTHPNGEHILIGVGAESYCGICVNSSYIMHPWYKALVLRENEKDLADWVSRARRLYEPMGADVTEKPARVTWPSGASFVLGHMQDSSAYTDYVGQEFHRILFEELTLIPQELLYLQIRLSCRSTFSCTRGCEPGFCICGQLKPQTLATTNPGNRGHLWVKKRFINVAPPDTIYSDPKNGRTRIYIPSLVTDNPYLMRNRDYVNELEGMPEPIRSAWRFGDWDALGGQYFLDFRPKGPLGSEPPEARHVYPEGSIPLSPWWTRWAGGDWGYGHGFAIYGGCQNQKGQTIIYKELVGNQTGSEVLGVEIGKMFFQDLVNMEKAGVTPSMELWLSPDAFEVRDDRSVVVEGIAHGIDKILGEGSAYIPDLWDETVLSTVFEGAEWGKLEHLRHKKKAKFRITIHKAANARVFGWQHMRDMMRFRQLASPNQDEFDNDYAARLLHENPDLYRSYVGSFEARKPEVLPRLLVLDCCKRLIEAIPTAVYKPETEDVLKVATQEDDCLDACRYLLYSKHGALAQEPKGAFVHRIIDEARENQPNLDYNDLVWIARQAEDKYKGTEARNKPFSLPMESNRHFRKRRLQ